MSRQLGPLCALRSNRSFCFSTGETIQLVESGPVRCCAVVQGCTCPPCCFLLGTSGGKRWAPCPALLLPQLWAARVTQRWDRETDTFGTDAHALSFPSQLHLALQWAVPPPNVQVIMALTNPIYIGGSPGKICTSRKRDSYTICS